MLTAKKAIQAHASRAGGAEPQEKETVEYGQFAAIGERRPASGSVGPEVADRHFAGEQERNGLRKETQDNQCSAESFQDTRYAKHGGKLGLAAADSSQDAEEFLPAMQGESKAHHDPHQGSQEGLVGFEKCEDIHGY